MCRDLNVRTKKYSTTTHLGPYTSVLPKRRLANVSKAIVNFLCNTHMKKRGNDVDQSRPTSRRVMQFLRKHATKVAGCWWNSCWDCCWDMVSCIAGIIVVNQIQWRRLCKIKIHQIIVAFFACNGDAERTSYTASKYILFIFRLQTAMWTLKSKPCKRVKLIFE